MAVDFGTSTIAGDKVRLYDVVNVAPTQVTDYNGNLVDGISVTFAVAGIANQTAEFILKGITVKQVQDAIISRVLILVEILDIEGPLVSLDADGKPILPNPIP